MVYLPPCYATSGVRYPTLILLHGGGADETQWPDVGLAAAADRLINQGRVPPFIVAAPDGGSDRGSETFVLNQLLPWMDGRLRSRTTRADRGIGGISLGGGSALRIAASHPGVFGSVGGHSPAVRSADRDLAAILADHGTRMWLDVAQDDSLRPAVEDLAAKWRSHHVAVELHVAPGRHDRPYWRSQMENYLIFYAKGWS
ncbi:MAG TPA: alpha/beta hydrolase-fold protein [Acidimicrobiia bacterium]|nr:alpha/beta hydrolase-fold protein [Acidimicrobiia bacterium]